MGGRRSGDAAPERVRRIVHDAFAHRRKTLASSLELASGKRLTRAAVRNALRELDIAEDARAEALAPGDFVRLADHLERS